MVLNQLMIDKRFAPLGEKYNNNQIINLYKFLDKPKNVLVKSLFYLT